MGSTTYYREKYFGTSSSMLMINIYSNANQQTTSITYCNLHKILPLINLWCVQVQDHVKIFPDLQILYMNYIYL